MGAQVQLVFDGLVLCRRALEIDREPTDQLMDFGRNLPQTFRMRIMMASDPGITLSKLREGSPAFHGSTGDPTATTATAAMPSVPDLWTRGV
ncbi:hypothetical protein TcBrA4_0046800 [Trypanosoma cruzi]|nr:hypothetical protein TcBrA4_0046800 [Trypanosoma cruzi]